MRPKPKKDSTSTARQRRYVARKLDSGLVQVNVFVPESGVEKIKELAAYLRRLAGM